MKRLDMSTILSMRVQNIFFVTVCAKAQQSCSGAVFDNNLWIAKGEI